MPTHTQDRDVVRGLASQIAEIAQQPANRDHDRAWRNLNAMKSGTRPLVWINEIPWGEMNVGDELTLQCAEPFYRALEDQFRRTLYQWRHMRGHMIVEGVYYCPLVIRDSGFGIRQEGCHNPTGPVGGIKSQHFEPQIKEIGDVDKIRFPEISLDREASDRRLAEARELLGDILEVRQRGIAHQWFTLWDNLIRWYGVQEAMMDFILKPDLVHAAVQRLLDAFMHRLDRYEELGVLSPTNGPMRVGSGGYACTDELPENDLGPGAVTAAGQWGCANAQMLSDVSPAMHEEFSLQYGRRWLERFAMTYYGCCEALHNKLGILASIPNLRKISMSPWADVEKMVQGAGNRYVLSFKPNPAVFADPSAWHPEWARNELEGVLEKTRGCCVEIIMKDISTVSGKPQRLWEWARIAVETADRHAG